MQNTYFTADRERRKAECLAQSDAITPDQIPDVDCGLYHLAGLLYGDFPNELITALSKKGKVSADIQGFLRHNENGLMNFHDWKDKLDLSPLFRFSQNRCGRSRDPHRSDRPPRRRQAAL